MRIFFFSFLFIVPCFSSFSQSEFFKNFNDSLQWRLSIGGSHSVLNGELKDTFFDDLDDYNDAYTSTGRGSVEGSFEGVFSPLVGVELIYPISSALDAKIGVRTQYRGWTETSSGYLNTTPFVSDDGTEVIGTSEFEQSLSFQMRYWDIPIGIVYELNDFIDLEFAMFTSISRVPLLLSSARLRGSQLRPETCPATASHPALPLTSPYPPRMASLGTSPDPA